MHIPRNTFQQTMVDLDFNSLESADLFSRACVEQFDDAPIHAYGYSFAQVFESHVLKEISTLEQTPYSQLSSLQNAGSSRLEELRHRIANIADLQTVSVINVVAALISISRFEKATEVLRLAEDRPNSTHRDKFEIAMLSFVIANRVGNWSAVRAEFRNMKAAVEGGWVSPNRVLDAAAQAIVWYMKGKLIPHQTYKWFLSRGSSIVDSCKELDPGALSSWFRAIAMIPAAANDMQATRRYMASANSTAREAMAARPRAYEQHYLKTYYESTVKEHMYVTKDRDAALQAGADLIAIDPLWSVSYGENAEIYKFFGETEAAAESFEKAGLMGPPYVGHHLFSSAQFWEKAQNFDRAKVLYDELLDLFPDNPAVVVAGSRLSKKMNENGDPRFSAALLNIKPTMTEEHLRYLQE